MSVSWQPSASIGCLRQRAAILNKIRQFFADRGIIEVETPLLGHATVTDPYIQSIPATFSFPGSSEVETVYLQTSPEYAMKRLLAAGSGPIYQITKAFRQGEVGRYHNPEFTMLEWYRPDFDHHDLMDEVVLFLQEVLGAPSVERNTVKETYEQYLQIDPYRVSLEALNACLVREHIEVNGPCPNIPMALDVLFSHCIEPKLGKERPILLYDFPYFQAALAKIRDDGMASRFELYFHGIELANGFHELQNPIEQRVRFEKDLSVRSQSQTSVLKMDERFLAALQHGLPDCAGVALGVDRLMMLALNQSSIASVLSFPFEYA